jgi:hypothetical protein
LYDKQENVSFWSTINTGSVTGKTPENAVRFERTIISIIFSEPTDFPKLFVYSSGEKGHPIPEYTIVNLDERFAQIMFYGGLSGFDVDITNVQKQQ